MRPSAYALLVVFGLGCAGPGSREPRVATPPPAAATKTSSPPPHFEGLGRHARKVTTKSTETQRYFDQGVAFMSAFNHDEAERAFLRAAELDPSCVMVHWGVAMANGPHINNPEVDASHAKTAWAALGRARAAAVGGVTKVEKDLVDALGKRYADPQPADRKALDVAYATAMRAVYEAHRDDVDVAVWFVEALMDLRPWDYWTSDGKPQPGTDEIVTVLEAALKKDAQHALANHLYIHLVEASSAPEKADAAADRLRDLAPGLGHLVHMPSHIDIRRGRWAQAIVTNEKAIAADARYVKLSPKQGFYNLYMGHNWHMLAFAAMMLGQSEKALAAIRAMVDGVDPEWARENAMFADGLLAMPVEVLMRFGRWQEILAAPEPPAYFPLSRALRHYARGVAYAAEGDATKARAEHSALREATPKIPKDAKFGNNTALAVAGIAESVLTGEIAAREGKMDAAITALREAVRREDALLYDEPPDWVQPVRHALGATLIRAGKAAEAEAVYREDLKRNAENGWSLFGLERALRMQKKTDEAKVIAARFTKAWESADVKLSSSCFCLPGI